MSLAHRLLFAKLADRRGRRARTIVRDGTRRAVDNAIIELFATHAGTLVEAQLTICVYVC